MSDLSPFDLKLLYYGDLRPGTTSVHRMEAIGRLVSEIAGVCHYNGPDGWSLVQRIVQRCYRTGIPAPSHAHRKRNAELLAKAIAQRPAIVWLDKPLDIMPATLSAIRAAVPGVVIVGYSPDDMGQRHNRSKLFDAIGPLFDVFFTTKSFGVAELSALGFRRVEFIANAFDPISHAPTRLTPAEQQAWGSDVSFIGAFERERADSIDAIAQLGIDVRVWGTGWGPPRKVGSLRIEGRPANGPDFAKVISASRINLGFLRKLNRDLQTTRSVELPACGAFMLAERTIEHLELFREGKEAEFFSSDNELITKVQYYLGHEKERAEIARQGRKRCLDSGYSNDARLGKALKIVTAVDHAC